MARDIAARLRHRITVQKPELSAGEAGQFTVSWLEVAVLWAEIAPKMGAQEERVTAEQLSPVSSHTITLRYREDVDAGMRVAYEGRYFNIRNVIRVGERKEFLLLHADEYAAT